MSRYSQQPARVPKRTWSEGFVYYLKNGGNKPLLQLLTKFAVARRALLAAGVVAGTADNVTVIGFADDPITIALAVFIVFQVSKRRNTVEFP